MGRRNAESQVSSLEHRHGHIWREPYEWNCELRCWRRVCAGCGWEEVWSTLRDVTCLGCDFYLCLSWTDGVVKCNARGVVARAVSDPCSMWRHKAKSWRRYCEDREGETC